MGHEAIEKSLFLQEARVYAANELDLIAETMIQTKNMPLEGSAHDQEIADYMLAEIARIIHNRANALREGK